MCMQSDSAAICHRLNSLGMRGDHAIHPAGQLPGQHLSRAICCHLQMYVLHNPLLTLAWMEPPRETMPVTRLAVRGMWRSSTPAWMVK